MTDYLATVPPQDLESEQSVLGAVFLDNHVLAGVVEVVQARDFYHGRNHEIFETMLRLSGDQTPIDAVTVAAELRARGTFDKIGGGAYLAELAGTVPTARNATHYAKTVHELALCRDLGRAAYQVALDSLGARDPEFLIEAQSRFDQVHARLAAPREPTTAETSASVLADMRDNRQPSRFTTDLADVDDATDGGLGRGEFITAAGLTGRGKSSLAANISSAVAGQGYGVVFVSLEMPQTQLVERVLCASARVNLGARLRGLRPDEDARLQEAQRRLAALDLEFVYRPGIKPSELRALAQRYHRDWPNFGLLVVDYIGLMRPDRREERRERDVASITLALKHLAGELNIAVLAMSQFNRGPARERRTPQLADLKDAGAVEQDSDLVFLLHDDTDTEEPLRKVNLIVAKNRRGKCWVTVPLWFNARQTRFENAADLNGLRQEELR